MQKAQSALLLLQQFKEASNCVHLSSEFQLGILFCVSKLFLNFMFSENNIKVSIYCTFGYMCYVKYSVKSFTSVKSVRQLLPLTAIAIKHKELIPVQICKKQPSQILKYRFYFSYRCKLNETLMKIGHLRFYILMI